MTATGNEAVTISQLKFFADNLGGGFDIDAVYPVGSVYLSMANTNPSSLFGGTWQKLEGRFLLTSSSNYEAGSTGGSNDAVVVSHNHSASTASAGSHNHDASTDTSDGHRHTISGGSHNHTANIVSSGAHTHKVNNIVQVTSTSSACATTSSSPYWYVKNVDATTTSSGSHNHSATVSYSATHTHSCTSTGSHSHAVTVDTDGSHSHSVTVYSEGESGTGKNMPAYLVVNAWQRTA